MQSTEAFGDSLALSGTSFITITYVYTYYSLREGGGGGAPAPPLGIVPNQQATQ